MLDTDTSLFTVGGVLNQIQGDREVVIAYASRRLRQSQVTCLRPVSEPDLITSSLMDKTLTIVRVREWVWADSPPPWSDCAGLSPELRLWPLQFSNLSIDLDGRLWRRRAAG